jgi:hypothetical protein
MCGHDSVFRSPLFLSPLWSTLSFLPYLLSISPFSFSPPSVGTAGKSNPPSGWPVRIILWQRHHKHEALGWISYAYTKVTRFLSSWCSAFSWRDQCKRWLAICYMNFLYIDNVGSITQLQGLAFISRMFLLWIMPSNYDLWVSWPLPEWKGRTRKFTILMATLIAWDYNFRQMIEWWWRCW